MSSICLAMIVRDESAVIERCLDSVRELIDTWVICDTGSVDGTPAVIERALDGIPGELHERPWRDFGHNRSELMSLARGKADFLLLLDADMVVQVDGPMPPELTGDAYLLRHLDEPEYWIKRLVRADWEWSYVGSTHEYLDCAIEHEELQLAQLAIDHRGDGGARADKFERDLVLLQRDLAANPDDARSVFYLAQTHRDLGNQRRAAELYEQRAAMGGWDQEVFYAMYQAGILRAELDEWPEAMATLLGAWEMRPARMEPLYELASRLRVREQYESAHVFATRGLNRPIPSDVLFVHAWVYRWGLLFEYSITAYWTGHAAQALRACDALLKLPDLPDEYREQTLRNREFCVERLAQSQPAGGTTSSTAGHPRQRQGRRPRR